MRSGAASTDLDELRERVNRTYGAFGVRAVAGAEESAPRRAAPETDWKRSAWIIASVFLASLFLSLVSHPAWADPGEWANSFRLDAAFIIVWGPLLLSLIHI